MITIPSVTLKDALKRVGPAVDRRSPLKAFQSVRIRASADQFEMTAGAIDGQATFRTTLDDLLHEEIDVLVEADRLSPLVAMSGKTVGIAVQKNQRVKFSTSSHTVTAPSLPGGDFPAIKFEGSVIADFDVVGLSALLSRVMFAAEPKDIRPSCQGVWIESDGEFLSTMATDAKIMAVAQVPLAAPAFKTMLSVSACELLVALDPKHVVLTSSHFRAIGADSELTVNPVSASPIDWRRLFPEPKNSVTFDGDALREAVSMHRHYSDKIGAVRFKTEGSECTVEISDGETSAESELEAELGTDETTFNFSFNGAQLSKILTHASEDQVTFYWNSAEPRAFLVQNGNWRGDVRAADAIEFEYIKGNVSLISRRADEVVPATCSRLCRGAGPNGETRIEWQLPTGVLIYSDMGANVLPEYEDAACGVLVLLNPGRLFDLIEA